MQTGARNARSKMMRLCGRLGWENMQVVAVWFFCLKGKRDGEGKVVVGFLCYFCGGCCEGGKHLQQIHVRALHPLRPMSDSCPEGLKVLAINKKH